jgi:hypothetical protein
VAIPSGWEITQRQPIRKPAIQQTGKSNAARIWGPEHPNTPPLTPKGGMALT